MMTEKAIGGAKGSPLRQRMIDQMRIANLAESTQCAYLFEVERMAKHYGASPADEVMLTLIGSYRLVIDGPAGLENRHDFRVEDIGQRVRAAPAPRLLLLQGRRRIGGQPVSGGSAEARLGGRHLDGVGLLLGHE